MRANRPAVQEEPGPGDERFNGGGSRGVRRRGGCGGPFRSGVEGVSKLSEDRSQGGRAGRLDCWASYFGVRTGERQTGKGRPRMGWRGRLVVLMVPCKGEQDRTMQLNLEPGVGGAIWTQAQDHRHAG